MPRGTLLRTLLFALAALTVACASNEPPPAAPHPVPRPPSDPAAQSLTKAECESLSQWIGEACQGRASLRSARVDGWCGDVERGSLGDDAPWIADCVKHVK